MALILLFEEVRQYVMDGMDLKDLKWSMEMMFIWLTLLNENALVGLGDLTSIPCPHSIATILWKQEDIATYVFVGY
ncbi:hypothetical protein Gogos_020226, partial [Gossypium gossypioides]|nr:hypothetical protein [Gossypium gossypioides]